MWSGRSAGTTSKRNDCTILAPSARGARVLRGNGFHYVHIKAGQREARCKGQDAATLYSALQRDRSNDATRDAT